MTQPPTPTGPDGLLRYRMADGSQHFAEVPWLPPLELKQRIELLNDVKLIAFIDAATEAWIDFDYRGHSFTAHNPLNDYWLFVRDPSCPKEILLEVTRWLTRL